jgi:hypothetical protein
MIKPVVQRGIRIPTIEVAGGCRDNDERKQDTDGEKQDAFHRALLSFPSQFVLSNVRAILRESLSS